MGPKRGARARRSQGRRYFFRCAHRSNCDGGCGRYGLGATSRGRRRSRRWGMALLLAPPASGGPRTLVLASDAAGNEALVVAATYAGARRPLHDRHGPTPARPSSPRPTSPSSAQCAGGDVRARYKRCAALLQREATDDQRSAALLALLREGRCRAYTSGCTMRLMGIGETTEAQADMLLCPGLSPGRGRAAARAAWTRTSWSRTRCTGSVHILTCDYLLHPRAVRAPARRGPAPPGPLAPRRRAAAAHVRLPARGLRRRAPFVVPVAVGGAELQIVVDTGAAVPLSLGRTAASRLTGLRAAVAAHARDPGRGARRARVLRRAHRARGLRPRRPGRGGALRERGRGRGRRRLRRPSACSARSTCGSSRPPSACGARACPPRGAATSAEGSCGKPLPACAA